MLNMVMVLNSSLVDLAYLRIITHTIFRPSYRYAPDRYIFVLTVRHVVLDNWSPCQLWDLLPATFGLIGAFTAYYYFNSHILGRRSELALDSIKNTMVMNLFYGYSMKNIH